MLPNKQLQHTSFAQPFSNATLLHSTTYPSTTSHQQNSICSHMSNNIATPSAPNPFRPYGLLPRYIHLECDAASHTQWIYVRKHLANTTLVRARRSLCILENRDDSAAAERVMVVNLRVLDEAWNLHKLHSYASFARVLTQHIHPLIYTYRCDARTLTYYIFLLVSSRARHCIQGGWVS